MEPYLWSGLAVKVRSREWTWECLLRVFELTTLRCARAPSLT